MSQVCRPFTGAWIETLFFSLEMSGQQLVAPSRGRGLKPPEPMPLRIIRSVAPSRGRGLKCKVFSAFKTTIENFYGVDANRLVSVLK